MTGPAILCLGEAMVEFNRQADGRWLEGLGGDVSNVAIAAARQGAAAGMVTRLGRDGFAAALRDRWAAEGIDTAAVGEDPDAPTGLYFVRHGPEGHSFEYRRAGSAASRMTASDLPQTALRSCRVLHLSGISQAISDSAAAACRAAMAAVRAAGGTISYDPNLRLALWPFDKARTAIHAAMAEADIALPGLDDARRLTGLQDPEAILAFYRDLGPRIIALTLGADGVLLADGERVERIPPHPARLVDAVGAGDCFDGAFLARWLECGDALEAARHATVAAALSVQGHGAVAPLPTRAAVDAARAAAAGTAPAPEPAPPRLRLALVAHDARKQEMVDWALRHRAALAGCAIVATGTTGARLADAIPELTIRRLLSGPLGGDQQIGALIAEGALDALIFFVDPLSPLPHDVDVKALTRLATVHDLPMACSRSTADILIAALAGG